MLCHFWQSLGGGGRGIDFTKTFAPVATMIIVHRFVAVVAACNWDVHQMEVDNAFLHGDLDEEVHMKLPFGFSSSRGDYGPGRADLGIKVARFGSKPRVGTWFGPKNPRESPVFRTILGSGRNLAYFPNLSCSWPRIFAQKIGLGQTAGQKFVPKIPQFQVELASQANLGHL